MVITEANVGSITIVDVGGLINTAYHYVLLMISPVQMVLMIEGIFKAV